ncbi:thioredoxin family protein [Tunicatimonas pelagia]|uniref:thioredoxin family protein n=1 Tax=Tunicatimonas pelagia TaxID=931531 RepID=UPI00266656DB|nr:thioredoxin family protein [Tunicatimonas pelagia]WKN45973.1 thioredoxin family protein [Tunicatimonas pelagia]
MSNVIKPQHLEAGMSYSAYRQLIDNLLDQSKTTGPNQSESYVKYTELNVRRMRRVEKTTKLQPELIAQLEKVNQSWVWVLLTEGWCGDAAQSVPVIAQMAEVSPNIQLHILLRDEHPEVMDAYLTNGGRSIPKLICLNEELETLGSWGPRPEAAQQLFDEFKERYGDKFRDHYSEWSEQLQLWYARDRTQAIQEEFSREIASWLAITSA